MLSSLTSAKRLQPLNVLHKRTITTERVVPPFDTLFPGQDANLFGTGENQCGVTVEGYCYFTVNDTMVFAS